MWKRETLANWKLSLRTYSDRTWAGSADCVNVRGWLRQYWYSPSLAMAVACYEVRLSKQLLLVRETLSTILRLPSRT